jgi:single-strand DNA-binding protein
MSRDLNKCAFIGRLGNDPEIRSMPNGTAVANLSLAVGDDYKDKQGNKVEQTEWIRVSAFGSLAEVIGKYLHKGSKVYIEGKMKTRKYEQDGITKYATEINANEMYMLDGKPDGQSQQPRNAPPQSGGPDDDFDSTIPF